MRPWPHRALHDGNTFSLQVCNDIFERHLGEKTQIARVGGGVAHIGVHHRPRFMQVDLLRTKVQCVSPRFELSCSHAEHTLIKRTGFFNAGDGEDEVVERIQNDGHGV